LLLRRKRNPRKPLQSNLSILSKKRFPPRKALFLFFPHSGISLCLNLCHLSAPTNTP
jgi:hypothetical protein